MLILRSLFLKIPNLGGIFINALQQLLIGVVCFSAYISAEHFCGKHSCYIGIIEFTAVALAVSTTSANLAVSQVGLSVKRIMDAPLLMYHLKQ